MRSKFKPGDIVQMDEDAADFRTSSTYGVVIRQRGEGVELAVMSYMEPWRREFDAVVLRRCLMQADDLGPAPQLPLARPPTRLARLLNFIPKPLKRGQQHRLINQ